MMPPPLPPESGPLDLNVVTLGEVYRTILRVEAKVDEVSKYAHDQSHQLQQNLTKVVGEVSLLQHDTDQLGGYIRRVNRRVDDVYKNAAKIASVISGGAVSIAGLVLAWLRGRGGP